jgi:hypothetical protein
MIYTVIWTRTALDALADIYNQATDKAAVTAASHRLDQELRRNAHLKGLDQGAFRLLDEPPLRAAFTVDPADCMVRMFWMQQI